MHITVMGHDFAAIDVIFLSMNAPESMGDDWLGTRETRAEEPESMAAFLLKARSLGFSEDEIVRLRSYYDVTGKADHARHQAGRRRN